MYPATPLLSAINASDCNVNVMTLLWLIACLVSTDPNLSDPKVRYYPKKLTTIRVRQLFDSTH